MSRLDAGMLCLMSVLIGMMWDSRLGEILSPCPLSYVW